MRHLHLRSLLVKPRLRGEVAVTEFRMLDGSWATEEVPEGTLEERIEAGEPRLEERGHKALLD